MKTERKEGRVLNEGWKEGKKNIAEGEFSFRTFDEDEARKDEREAGNEGKEGRRRKEGRKEGRKMGKERKEGGQEGR